MRTVEQWRTEDFILKTGKHYGNPFEDVDVSGIFTGPEGQLLKVLGFWDGDGTWVIRFAPTATGIWRYRTESSDPKNSEFRTEGELKCIPYEGDRDLYRHGFLKVSEDRTYLEYADGTPFFWLGDTHWTFVTEERFDESNCGRYESQFKACADKRVEQKFTVYQCNFRDGKKDGIFGRNLDLMQETDGGFLPNLPLFHENVDKKMKYLADCGFVIAAGYAWGFDMPSGGKKRYGSLAKYLAARYGALPVLWTLAGELPGYGKPDAALLADWNEVAKECEKWSAYGNLQSVHLACSRPFPLIYRDESWFDFAMSQAGHGDFDMGAEMYRDFRTMYEGKPVLESEAMYEGACSNEYSSRVITPAMMRRVAYLIMQNGGCGYTYGCNGVWELQWEAGVGGIGWGDMSWWDGLELPGADQLTFFREFYEEMGWSRLKPLGREHLELPSFLGEECPERSKSFFTGDAGLHTVVGYFTETSMRRFVLKGLTGSRYEAYWLDPETGEKEQLPGGIVPENGRWEYASAERGMERKDHLFVAREIVEGKNK